MGPISGSAALSERIAPPPPSLVLNTYERLLWRSVYDASTEDLVPGVRTGCLLWKGSLNADGYGQISVNGRIRRVHRIAYTLFAEIKDGLVLDHLCRNHACLNPNHLEPVTVAENNLRGEGAMAVHARKTHCPQGHPYDEKNTQMKNGARRCRACISVENRRYREKQKAARETGKVRS